MVKNRKWQPDQLPESLRLYEKLRKKNIVLYLPPDGYGDWLAEQIEYASATEGPILTSGETGTGKGVIAKSIHALSDRQDRRLVVVNCAALPGDTVESELFGHRKGAFTGASRDRGGLIMQAEDGYIPVSYTHLRAHET